MQPMTITTVWSLCERSLGDAEYLALAAMRTLILPLVKVRSNATHDHYHDAEYLAAMCTLVPLVKVRSSETHDHFHNLVAV